MEFFASNPTGIKAKWVSHGASLAELHVPDRDGNLADVVLGFDDERGYRSADNQHFGATTGRFANRIAGGRFSIEGHAYQLALNNGPNHLHGGPKRGLGLVQWN
ncbi:MAG: galactose-1-epimerase, partial [Pirellulales bacterium]|nr:galactose-1-epimerase [Pirellulales bacterium]